MANYGIIIGDNGDNSFYLIAVNRGTTSTTFTGGTNLLTDTFTQTASTGALATASGFLVTTNLDSTTANTDSLGRKIRSVCAMAEKAGQICQNDRAFNG